MTTQEKFLNKLYQFESSVPRREYFSKVVPLKWNFQCYCADRLQKEQDLNPATLKRDFLSDLQWLRSKHQKFPRELMKHVKSLEDTLVTSLGSNKRQELFEDTVTAYSQAVAKTVQAEVQKFSNPASLANSNITSCSTTSSSSASIKKRTRYSIHDFIADNESCILAFGKHKKYIVNDTDVVLEFKKFQKNSIEHLKSASYIDPNYDLHRMLALSNILIVDKVTNSNIHPDILPKDTYRLMKQDFIKNHRRDIKFNAKLYQRVKRILEKYFFYKTSNESDESIREANNESRIKLLKLARKANKYEKAAIEVIVTLIPTSTNNKLNRVSELHLSSSYIHTVISSIFGSSDIIPHCSNILPCERTEGKSKERPDYICDKYTNQDYDYSTVYGEIKTSENTSNLNQDLYRLAYFSKNAVDTYNLGMCLSFQAIGTLVNFYSMTLQHEATEILLELDTLTQLAHIHDTLCKPIQKTILHSPTASFELFDLKTKSKTKL
ncbi:hypothetical protein CLU79DRAFT_750374 [Phycomyces nitens]|nr:hypothetical protein CLU79DRAFT_750374 [Phycomyces nitens]